MVQPQQQHWKQGDLACPDDTVKIALHHICQLGNLSRSMHGLVHRFLSGIYHLQTNNSPRRVRIILLIVKHHQFHPKSAAILWSTADENAKEIVVKAIRDPWIAPASQNKSATTASSADFIFHVLTVEIISKGIFRSLFTLVSSLAKKIW